MLAYGLKVTVLGMGIVFIALCLLMLLIKGQSKFFVQKAPQTATSLTKEGVEDIENASDLKYNQEIDDETVAVIAAAIQAVCGGQIVVKNIKRITGSQGSVWSQMGRIDAMNLRKL